MGSCCSPSTVQNETSSTFDPNEKISMLGFNGEGTQKTNNIMIMDEEISTSQHNMKHSQTQQDKVDNNNNNNNKCKRYKILLLGPGMSGKTTLFKQMRKLHGSQFTTKDFINCKSHLTANLIEAFRKLCIYSDILSEQQNNDITIKNTKVNIENREIRDQVARLNDRALFDYKLYNTFNKLLLDKGIQSTLKHRYKFQLSDNFDYLISNMDKYYKTDYIPSYADYLNVKQRTVGIQKLKFKLQSKTDGSTESYDLHDAGGQRTERKKWMNVIHGATAYIFVAAISGYNQSLWEEPSYNRMREAVHLFRRIYHMDALNKAHCILFLNKYDLFQEKIKKYSIKQQFPEYQGKETSELVATFIVNLFKQQQHPKYGDHKCHNNHTDKSCERSIYFHFTSATDTECVNRVFELCRDIIVLNLLTNIGFV